MDLMQTETLLSVHWDEWIEHKERYCYAHITIMTINDEQDKALLWHSASFRHSKIPVNAHYLSTFIDDLFSVADFKKVFVFFY